MNFLQIIYAKSTANKSHSESLPLERLQSASQHVQQLLTEQDKQKQNPHFIKQLQHHLNEIVLSVEEEVRFCKSNQCLTQLLASSILTDVLNLSKIDKPVGVVKIALTFYQQIIEVTNDYFRETNSEQSILSNKPFLTALLSLLNTSKSFYNRYDDNYVELSCIICKLITESSNTNPYLIDSFVMEDFSCPLVDSLIKCLHLTNLKKGMNSRNGILNFLKSINSKKVAKYIFKHSDLALLTSISLGAHFSQLKNTLIIEHQLSNYLTLEKEHKPKLPKEICTFLATINFCQDMLQVVEEKVSYEYKEFKQMFVDYLIDHIKTYFLKNILKTLICESSDFNISALMYYCSWIVRIVYITPLKELFLNFLFCESFCEHSIKRSGYLWNNFSLSSLNLLTNIPNNSGSNLNLSLGNLNVSRESLVSTKITIPTLLIAQLTSTKQECLLTCFKMFSNLFCYHPNYAITELLISNSTIYYCTECSCLTFYQNIKQFLSLINSLSCGGSFQTENFHRLQKESCEKIKSKFILFDRVNYQQIDIGEMREKVKLFKSNYFYSLLLTSLSNYWKNSFCVNVAMIEFIYEILTCPIPIIYSAFCNNFTDSKDDDNSFFNCILEIIFKNDFVIKRLSDSHTVDVIYRLRQNESIKTGGDDLLFAQNYLLLEEFIKEMITIFQGHALNYYGCISFE